MIGLVTPFDQWVNDHNPPIHLEYGKGWWDYVEILRRLMHKFEAEGAQVIATYTMKTPPPTEELCMPVVQMNICDVELVVKYDFGVVPERWTVSVRNGRAKQSSTLGLFDENTDLRLKRVDGFQTQWIYPPYRESSTQFSCELADEWDLATLFRLVSEEDD